jgi:transcriptional regulator GlxA family with amidase domain
MLSVRLLRAGLLLKTESVPVTEVAYGVGLKSFSRFTERFRLSVLNHAIRLPC